MPLPLQTCAHQTEPHSPWEDLPGAVHHTNLHTHHAQSATTELTAVMTA